MDKEDQDIEKAVEAVDRMEDEAAAKREKESEGEEAKEPLVCCPRCKRPVTDGDYVDQFSNPMEDSLVTKIECPQCGYIGLPVEIDPDELKRFEGKK